MAGAALAARIFAALRRTARLHAAAPTPPTRAYDKIVDAVIARYHLPGIAVGVIENGQVVYTRTAGETVAGSGQKITPQTLFKIASNSKAMTTALLGRLVDQGKLRWDDPVTKYLPQFRMHDPWVTANMRVADLLTHSSGLPEGGGDLMLWPEPNAFTRADIIHGLRYHQARLQLPLAIPVRQPALRGRRRSRRRRGRRAVRDTDAARGVRSRSGLTRCQVGAWNRDAVGNVAQPHRREDGRNVAIARRRATIPAITSAAGRRHPLRPHRHAELGAQLAGADARAAAVAVAGAARRSCRRRTC